MAKEATQVELDDLSRGSEAERLERWRELQALELGCSQTAAANFAQHSAASMADLRDLVRGGCPPELAADILL